MESNNPLLYFWKGKQFESYSKEELIEICKRLADMYSENLAEQKRHALTFRTLFGVK